MKIAIFDTRPDELQDLNDVAGALECQLVTTDQHLAPETAALAAGCVGATCLGQAAIDRKTLEALRAQDVTILATRTIGYDHIDLAAATELGIRVCNSKYEPDGVADFTVMLILAVLRKLKPALERGQMQDFALKGLQGRELKDLTVGVLGTGWIGFRVIRSLSGFGCRLIAYDIKEDPAVREFAQYVDRDTLYRESDVLTLHLPLSDSTRHLIDDGAIGQMKPGAVLINSSRGELVDTDALIRGLESGKLGGVGLDTVEGEQEVIYADHRTDPPQNPRLSYLRQFPNAVVTGHIAFYTDEAVENMARSALTGIHSLALTGTCPGLLN